MLTLNRKHTIENTFLTFCTAGLKRAKFKLFTIRTNLAEYFQTRFNGTNPECVTDALLMAQDRVNKEHGGREVLWDIDILNLGLTLMGAG